MYAATFRLDFQGKPSIVKKPPPSKGRWRSWAQQLWRRDCI